jgi:hypothetical protein
MRGPVENGWARFGLPGLALGLAIAWGMTGFRGEQAVAQQAPRDSTGPVLSTGGGNGRSEMMKGQSARTVAATNPGGTLALIANPTGAVQWLYLVDTKQKSFAIYRIDPNNPKGSVKLEASRKYRWDLELDEYNNQGLEPSAVEARVRTLTQTR